MHRLYVKFHVMAVSAFWTQRSRSFMSSFIRLTEPTLLCKITSKSYQQFSSNRQSSCLKNVKIAIKVKD